MKKTEEILKELEALREYKINLIAVSNSEWYTLFKDEIRNSIAIEGIFANRNELLDVLDKNKKTDDQKTAAILGYFDAASSLYEYANNLYKEDEFRIRIADLKQIHTLLMRYEKDVGSFKGKLGEFRNEPVEITRAAFTPLDYLFVRETMDLFVKWINENLDSNRFSKLQLAALSHILFETIHPFKDGNGRAGRIFLSFMLIGMGLINVAIKGTQQSDRNNYYRALEEGDDKFEKMLRKIESGKKLTLREVNDYAGRSETSKLENIILKRLNDSLQRISKKPYRTMNQEAELPLRDVAKFFNYSQDYLRNLINKKKIPARKIGKLWHLKIRDVERYINNISNN